MHKDTYFSDKIGAEIDLQKLARILAPTVYRHIIRKETIV